MSDKKITENPSMGDLSKFKSLGRQSVDALGGLNLPQLQQGLEAAANGEQITGQRSEQVGISCIKPATIPQLQAPASMVPSGIIFGYTPATSSMISVI